MARCCVQAVAVVIIKEAKFRSLSGATTCNNLQDKKPLIFHSPRPTNPSRKTWKIRKPRAFTKALHDRLAKDVILPPHFCVLALVKILGPCILDNALGEVNKKHTIVMARILENICMTISTYAIVSVLCSSSPKRSSNTVNAPTRR